LAGKSNSSDVDEVVRSRHAFSQSEIADLFKGLGSLAYQEVAARLHAAGTGRRQDTKYGLKGGVVNETGALFAARERAFGKNSTDYRLGDGDIQQIAKTISVAFKSTTLPPQSVTRVIAQFLADGTLPSQLEDYFAKTQATYQADIAQGKAPDLGVYKTFQDLKKIESFRFLQSQGMGPAQWYKESKFQYGVDFSLDTMSNNLPLFTTNRKVAEWFRSMESGIDTRSYVDENAAYQNINWAKYKGKDGLGTSMFGYSRRNSVGHPLPAAFYARDIVWPDTLTGEKGDEFVLALMVNNYGKSMGEDHAKAAKGMLEIAKRVTGKNYSTLVVEMMKAMKEAGTFNRDATDKWSLSGAGTSYAGEKVQVMLQTAVLQKLVTWLRSQKGETNAQRTMTKEFDAQAPQNSIEGIGGAHHGKVRATWEELASELERAFMRTKEQLVSDVHERVDSLTEASIANAYLTTAIREALVAKFEADGVPYDSYKQVLEDVFGYMLNEQRAQKYSRGDEGEELLRKLNFQRSMPAVRMASPEVADIITYMLSSRSITSRVDDSSREFDSDILSSTGDLVAASKYDADAVRPSDEKAIKQLLASTMGFKGAELDAAYEAITRGRWQNLFSSTRMTQKEIVGNKKVAVQTPFSGQAYTLEAFKERFGIDVAADGTSVRQMNNYTRGLTVDPEDADTVEYRTTSHEGFIRQAANIFNRQLEDLNELLRYTMGKDANQSGETASTVGEETALKKNGNYLGVSKTYTSLKELKADIKKLQDLKKRAIAAYEGKDASEVSLKAKPYKQVIAERLAKGELMGVTDLFNELRTYGIKRISIREMIELTKMATESREIDLGAETNAAVFSEQKDFQLLMFLDSISGLQYETDPNQVSVTEEGNRGWSYGGRGQFGAGSGRGEYLIRTDGDMRTILEEFHHQLVQNNETYRLLSNVGDMEQSTGAAWKKNFIEAVDVAEQNLRNQIADDAKKFGDTPEGISNSERTAAKAMGSMALVTLARLWIRSFDVDRRNFGLSSTLSKDSASRVNSNSPASEILFSTNTPATKSGGRLARGDQTFNKMDKFYYGGMEKDYHFKNLIEFAAGALNDSHVQSILAQQDPIVDENGREPMQGLIDDMQVLGNKHMITYASRYERVMTKAKTLLDQLVNVIKTMIQFQQTTNHSTQGTEFARNKVKAREQEIRGKRTALEQALEASASVLPRHKGTANELPYKGDINALRGTARSRYEATSGDFNEGLLDKYLGRVRGTFKPESK
jgi:hypothetical protein